MASAIAAHERDPYSIVDDVLKKVHIKEQPTPEGDALPASIQRIQHLGIAVQSIDHALRFWRDALGLDVCEKEIVADQGVKVAMLPIGEGRIELLEPTEAETPVGRFLTKRGQGIHHVCVQTQNIRETLQALKTRNVRLIDEEPRLGAGGNLVAFVHPESTGGVLVELVECTERTGSASAPGQSVSQ
jgi:methylmalonyl-CoA/ethylmalonyl-CoA epimerase